MAHLTDEDEDVNVTSLLTKPHKKSQVISSDEEEDDEEKSRKLSSSISKPSDPESGNDSNKSDNENNKSKKKGDKSYKKIIISSDEEEQDLADICPSPIQKSLDPEIFGDNSDSDQAGVRDSLNEESEDESRSSEKKSKVKRTVLSSSDEEEELPDIHPFSKSSQSFSKPLDPNIFGNNSDSDDGDRRSVQDSPNESDNGSRSGENNSKKKKDKKLPQRKASEQSRAKTMQELASKTQKLVRDSRVSLPYHKPKQLTLAEFLQRRNKAKAPVLTSLIKSSSLRSMRNTISMKEDVLPIMAQVQAEEQSVGSLKVVLDYLDKAALTEDAGVQKVDNAANAEDAGVEMDVEKDDDNEPSDPIPQEIAESTAVTTTVPQDLQKPGDDVVELIDDIEEIKIHETEKEENIPQVQEVEMQQQSNISDIPMQDSPIKIPTAQETTSELQPETAAETITSFKQQEAELNSFLKKNPPKKKTLTIAERLKNMPGFAEIANIKPKIGGNSNPKAIINLNKPNKSEWARNEKKMQSLMDRFIFHASTANASPKKEEHTKLHITTTEKDSEGMMHSVVDEIDYVTVPTAEEEDVIAKLNRPSGMSPQQEQVPGQKMVRLKAALREKIWSNKAKQYQEKLKLHAMYNEEKELEDKVSDDELPEDEELMDEEIDLSTDSEEEEELELDDVREIKKKPRKRLLFAEEEAEEEEGEREGRVDADEDYEEDSDDDEEELEVDKDELQLTDDKKEELRLDDDKKEKELKLDDDDEDEEEDILKSKKKPRRRLVYSDDEADDVEGDKDEPDTVQGSYDLEEDSLTPGQKASKIAEEEDDDSSDISKTPVIRASSVLDQNSSSEFWSNNRNRVAPEELSNPVADLVTDNIESQNLADMCSGKFPSQTPEEPYETQTCFGFDVDDSEDDQELVASYEQTIAEKPAVVRGLFGKDGRLKKKFVENEAELSGDEEENSEDEDERGLNYYEEEEGDEEDIDEDALKNEVERAHLKHLLDKDDRDIRRLQEEYLERGDLEDGKLRERKFRWNDVNEDFPDDLGRNSDGELGEDEDEEELKKKLEEIERRKWIHEHSEIFEAAEEESQKMFREKSRFLKLGKTTMRKIESFVENSSTSFILNETSNSVPDVSHISISSLVKSSLTINAKMMFSKSNTEKDDEDEELFRMSKTASQPMFASPDDPISKIRKGSFLSRGGPTLSRLAEMTKMSDPTGGTNVKNNSRNFVFSVITPPDQASKKMGPKRPANSQAVGGQPKKMARVDRSFKNLDESSKDSSIFKWM